MDKAVTGRSLSDEIMKLLREKGVLGMNARNAEYVLPNNERHLYPLVDDKVKTKQLAMANNIPVPKMYYVVKSPREIKNDFFKFECQISKNEFKEGYFRSYSNNHLCRPSSGRFRRHESSFLRKPQNYVVTDFPSFWRKVTLVTEINMET